MRIKDLKQTLKFLAGVNRVPFIEGPPGIGKSDTVRQFAAEQAAKQGLEFYEGPDNFDESKFGFIDFRSNVHDVTDLCGLPMIGEEVTKYTKPIYVPATGQGILFLDEFVQENPSKQAALNQLVLDRRVSSHKLGDGWIIVTAGNRTSDRSAAFRMPAHTSNRFVRIPIHFDIDGYIEYLFAQKMPDFAIAFAKFKPALLESFDPKMDVNCTPRSYESAIHMLDASEATRAELIAGCIGEGAATEMMAFERVWLDLPRLEDVILKPKKTPVPKEKKPDVMFAVASMLGFNVTPQNFPPMVVYLKRFGAREYLAYFTQAAIAKNKETMLDVPEFTDLITEIAEVL